LQELSPEQVERYMGPPAPDGEASYDWPELTREQVFDMVQLEIRAGTTGAPDRAEQQENWLKVFPVIKDLIAQLMQAKAANQDTGPLEALLRETVRRFDERLDIEQFLPQAAAPPPQEMLPQMTPSGMTPASMMNSPMNGA
jgi:hypothetical protein